MDIPIPTPSVTEVQQLISKGHKYVAKLVAQECKNAPIDQDGRPIVQLLPALLDFVLYPGNYMRPPQTVDWLRWLLAGEMLPTEYCAQMKKYDFASTCGLVWTANFVAYRCRTCSVSPCMSICASCFKHGDHVDHDYNMFKSQAGGACDCGNAAVMKTSGFCTRHGALPNPEMTVPAHLHTTARIVLPRIVQRIILHCRTVGTSARINPSVVVDECDHLLNYLQDLTELGNGMRTLLRDALCNSEYYKDLQPKPGDNMYDEKLTCRNNFLLAKANIPSVHVLRDDLLEDFAKAADMIGRLAHETYLDEIIFWTVKFEFPQKLVCFLLNMRPEPVYEEAFAKAFVQHYSRMSRMLATSSDTDGLSNSVVHISVQLFSDQSLALKMVDQCSLLHIIILSIRGMMNNILTPSIIHADASVNRHMVVNCKSDLMKNHCYWPLVSDLNNILSHRSIVSRFLSNRPLVQTWYKFISLLQGMNCNLRELVAHVDYEPQSYYASFSAESEIAAAPLWTTGLHFKHADIRDLIPTGLECCYAELEKWIYDIGFANCDTLNDEYLVSFHLPLHRNYALYLCHTIKEQGARKDCILPSEKMLQKICHHPLRNLAAIGEIANGLWVRNGLQMKGQAITYMQCHFCNYMVDLDLFLLQLAAGELPDNQFLDMVLSRFNVSDLVTFGQRSAKTKRMDSDLINGMTESFLTFMAYLVTTRTYIGVDEREKERLEMATVLCINDRTHAQVFDAMPEKSYVGHISPETEALLQSMAVFVKPSADVNGQMTQGTFRPKKETWEKDYDPIHASLRSVQKKDYQSSIDRFKEHCRKTNRASRTDLNMWPPYRLPTRVHKSFTDPCKILSHKSCQSVLLILLYKIEREKHPSETVLSLVIFLLDLVVDFQLKRQQDSSSTADESCCLKKFDPWSAEATDGDFNTWLPSDNIFDNASHHIAMVKLKKQVKIPPQRNPLAAQERSDSPMDIDFEVIDSIEDTPTQNARAIPSGSELVPYQESASALVPSTYPTTTDTEPGTLALGGGRVVARRREHNRAGAPTDSPRELPQLMPPTEFARRHEAMGEAFAIVSRDTPDGSLVPMDGATLYGDCLAIADHSSDTEYDDDQFSGQVFNESLLSLLLKLHSKLSGKPGSYEPNYNDPTEDCRMGDGQFFIAKLLNKLGKHSHSIRRAIEVQMALLFPGRATRDRNNAREKEDKDAVRRANKARMDRITRDFQSKQRKFLKLNDPTLGVPTPSPMEVDQAKTYSCVICQKVLPSTLHHPMGCIALTQSTSTLGSMRMQEELLALALSDEDLACPIRNQPTLAKVVGERAEILRNHFDLDSCLLSMNNGWEGGVHVQTCGHNVHLICLQTYMNTLTNPERHSQSDILRDSGEYRCPLCRKLANVIIPITPDEKSPVAKSPAPRSENDVQCIDRLLTDLSLPVFGSELTRSMAKLMEDLTKSTYSQYRTLSTQPSGASLFMFVSSILRTNLETELTVRGGHLVRSDTNFRRRVRSSCLLALLHVLSFHAKILAGGSRLAGSCHDGDGSLHWISQLWSSLTSRLIDGSENALAAPDKRVPMLFRDPVTLLLQLILLLPIQLEERFINLIFGYIYRLVVLKTIVSVLSGQGWKIRNLLCKEGLLAPLFLSVHCHLKNASVYSKESDQDPTQDSVAQATSQVQDLCLVFLRTASILINCLKETDLPYIEDSADECEMLEKFICVYDVCSVSNAATIEKLCGFRAGDPSWLDKMNHSSLLVPCRTWCADVARVARGAPIAASNLACVQRFFPPRLLTLPHNYDSIFQFYYSKTCNSCQVIPKDPAICLVCGALICLRENRTLEATKHAIDCGGGTSVFLAVWQCTVIVIRGTRACMWGCLYLDLWGEEDRELKRGRPLFLNQSRYRILEDMWINHSFDHSARRWMFHRDASHSG